MRVNDIPIDKFLLSFIFDDILHGAAYRYPKTPKPQKFEKLIAEGLPEG